MLPTPAVNDMGAGKTVEQWDAWTDDLKARHGNGNGHGKSLSIEAQRLTLLPTPAATDANGARNATSGQSNPDSQHHSGWTLNDIVYAGRLLPTPRSAADRTSREALTRDGHWSAPALAQAVELAEGVLPREYEHWGEVQGNQPTTWGEYAAAIARWEAILGRPAPEPTDDRRRLSPAFVEWMMGWPAGWVDVPGISRAKALKALGNGVVPQQAVVAFRQLLARAAAEVAA